MSDKPFTTLFMLASVDGKITTGDVDVLDVDKDFPRIKGIKEGLHQYYDLEKQTDRVSFNSGRVQEKVGANERNWDKERDDVSFIVVDNKPHLDDKGTEYFAKRSNNFFLITTNKNHPAFKLKDNYPTMRIFLYEGQIDFSDVFRRFKEEYNIENITIQTGGTLNAELLRLGLIDKISIVIAPALIGGNNTQSLIGGKSLNSEEDLRKIRALELIENNTLNNSYIHLVYKVINETKIEI